jgi:Predicted transcriptional regulators
MIGERLTILRERDDISQVELAKILNIGSTSISKYESNDQEPPDYMKIKIAKHFNVSLDYLCGVVDQPIVYGYNPKEIIKLPKGFPEKNISKLKSYMRFLMTDSEK